MKVVRVLTTIILIAVLQSVVDAASLADHGSQTSTSSTVDKAPTPAAREYTLPFPQGRISRARVSGDWVVALYGDIRSTGSNGQLLAYNLSTKKMYTPWASGAGHPDVDGNLVVFTGWVNAQETYPTLSGKPSRRMPSNLVVCDLKTGRYYCPQIGTTKAAEPAICGNNVAYTSSGHVFLVNLATGVNRQISDPTKGDRNTGLSICGDYVAWTTDCDPYRVQYYRISTGETLSFDSANPAVKCRDTATDGKVIVWTGVTSDNGNHYYDIATGQTGRCSQGSPGDIDNGLMVYRNHLKDDSRLYVHGLYFPLSASAFVISTDAADDPPSVSGSRVVWVGNNIVYCAELQPGKPVAKPLSAP